MGVEMLQRERRRERERERKGGRGREGEKEGEREGEEGREGEGGREKGMERGRERKGGREGGRENSTSKSSPTPQERGWALKRELTVVDGGAGEFTRPRPPRDGLHAADERLDDASTVSH